MMGDSKCFISVETAELFNIGLLSKTPNSSNLTICTCVVCGDRATGRHYGALSCEGCKGFFKRVARKKPDFQCRGAMDCEVKKDTRNCCQYCRLQKCLLNGMRRTLVQVERKPLETSEQEGGMAQMSSSTLFGDEDGFSGTSGGSTDDASSSPECEEMQTDSVGDRDSLNESWEKAVESISSLIKGQEDTTISTIFANIERDSLVPEESVPFTMISLPIFEDGVAKISHVNESASRLLFLTVHWTRSLPAFQALSPEMQVTLLKSSWTQLFTIGLFQCQDVICLKDVMKAIVLHYHHQHFSLNFTSQITAVTGCINKLDQFVKTAQSLTIDDFECAALKCLALFTPSHLDVVEFGTPDVNAVKDIHTSISWALADHLGGDSFRLADLLLLLPRLQSIDAACLKATFFPNILKMKSLDVVVPYILNMDSDFKILKSDLIEIHKPEQSTSVEDSCISTVDKTF